MFRRMKKFLSYYRPYLKLFSQDMFCAFVASSITLLYPLIIRYITGVVLLEEVVEVTIIYKLSLFLLIAIVIEGLCNYFIAYQGHVMGAYMERDLRNEMFSHYQKLSFGFYDEQKTGQLMSRITNDLFSLTELWHHGPEDLIISLVKFVGAFLILLTIHVQLTFIIFAFIPAMILFAFYYNRKMKRAFKRNKETIGNINETIEDNLSGIRVVKSFANEQREMEKFHHSNSQYVASKDNSYSYMGKYHGGLGVFISSISLVVIFFGSLYVAKGSLDISDLVAFMLYITNLTDPIKKLINFTEQFQEGAAGFDRFMEIMEVEPEIQDKKDAKLLHDVTGSIHFENVFFRYNDKMDYVLKNINLDIKAGQYIAFVGTSGVGKTTICSLIPRFYELTSGKIEIDGQSIEDVTLSSLRHNIGIVQQDVYLFAGSIMDNIRYGNLNATDQEVIEAAKKANAHDFIMDLEHGYDTDCGQRGIKLSGGQKQRLSIARVFLKNPPILIFDEATSALDNESEHVVQKSLESLAKNRTTLVIAHRLTTIQNADRILVLGENGIIEDGNHQALLDHKGQYASLFHRQFQ
ncbi:ABC transporter ATP-binding protein [Tannockella kyphosi]|uniref:ABC transporter ATP-binding protein n=1 Tax=Tannockella kyphosi TaxID=2899121 RepID=UPI0020121FAD|nr:ABC transporter ATP-binding protein [Tannockella kyphosi]